MGLLRAPHVHYRALDHGEVIQERGIDRNFSHAQHRFHAAIIETKHATHRPDAPLPLAHEERTERALVLRPYLESLIIETFLIAPRTLWRLIRHAQRREIALPLILAARGRTLGLPRPVLRG